MDLQEAKKILIPELEQWVALDPNGEVILPSGKTYTRTKWLSAIINDEDDAQEFLRELVTEAEEEVKE